MNAIDAERFPGVATSPVGAEGTVRGVTKTGSDGRLGPAAVIARILIDDAVPLMSPEMTNGLVATDGTGTTHGPASS
ncbi:unannotated protein [freshwater metagenome]|uniref:Unannotated protein n=1 Tax=freshwater metagenome TaxID=449393 RepID=A0A6J6HX40_9ZZZZ